MSRQLSAQEAQQARLISEVFPADTFMTEVGRALMTISNLDSSDFSTVLQCFEKENLSSVLLRSAICFHGLPFPTIRQEALMLRFAENMVELPPVFSVPSTGVGFC